jgi:exonuclease SbcD
MVKDPRLDYVALGHIHKPQNLNEDAHPPVIYPGSIERVDFGEAKDEKFFVIAHVSHGKTDVEWRELSEIRPFVDRFVRLEDKEDITAQLCDTLPAADQLEGAIVRLVVDYPRDWDVLIDEPALREYAAPSFEFHLVKRPQMDVRIRLPDDQAMGSLTPLELLELYWQASHVEAGDIDALKELATQVIQDVLGEEP